MGKERRGRWTLCSLDGQCGVVSNWCCSFLNKQAKMRKYLIRISTVFGLIISKKWWETRMKEKIISAEKVLF